MRSFETKLGGESVTIFAPIGDITVSQLRSAFPAGAVYGLDTETTYMGPAGQWADDFELRTTQFGTGSYAWVLDMTNASQRTAAVDLLKDESVTFCSHTDMDVMAVYTRLGVDISRHNWDTYVLAGMAAPDDRDGGKDLKTLATKHGMPELEEAEAVMHGHFKALWEAHVVAERALGVTGLSKTFSGNAKAWAWNNVPKDDASYLTYAGLDAIAARRLLDVLIPLTRASERLLEVEMWLAGAANRIRMRGALVDKGTLFSLHQESEEATQKANDVVRRITGYNVAQGKALQGWFGTRGVDWATWVEHGGTLTKPSKSNPDGSPSLAKGNLRVLLAYPLDDEAREVVAAMLDAQAHADALKKTQGVINALCPDGRVRSTLKTVGTVTARMASTGPNMQNFSKEDPRVRGAFVPKPGHVLVSCDFSQIELRVVAALAQEHRMIEAITNGDDLHQLTADLLGVDRDIAKRVNFLIVYGGGAARLAEAAGIDINLASQTVRKFWETYQGIASFNSILKEYRSAVHTISNRRIPVTIDDRNGQPKVYANMNYVVQSSARDLIVEAWHRLDHEYGLGDMVWGLIHDEMVLEVPESRTDEVVEAVQACMRMEFMGVPIDADAKVLRDKEGVSRWGKA